MAYNNSFSSIQSAVKICRHLQKIVKTIGNLYSAIAIQKVSLTRHRHCHDTQPKNSMHPQCQKLKKPTRFCKIWTFWCSSLQTNSFNFTCSEHFAHANSPGHLGHFKIYHLWLYTNIRIGKSGFVLNKLTKFQVVGQSICKHKDPIEYELISINLAVWFLCLKHISD